MWHHRFAVFTAFCTFLLIIAGGLVTSTGSGLSVPDWPLSYGQVMPPMVGGIFYEHGHRMIASFVGLLTVVLAFWTWRVEQRTWVKTLAWAALGAVIVQGVLGGITVLYLLPTPISVLHATIAQSFFSLTIVLALVTSQGWKRHVAPERQEASVSRILGVLMIGAVLLQLVLGAWMRHSGAGLAITDFPLSYGRILPPLNQEVLREANDARVAMDLPPVSMGQVWIHFAHRVGAMLAGLAILIFTIHVLRTYPHDKGLRDPALIQIALLCFQLALGALTVWTGKGVEVATMHVATGAVLLGNSVLLTFQMFHYYRVRGNEMSTAAEMLTP